jgi:hypothetical protein
MATLYEYWQHRITGEVWAVKLVDGRVVGVTDIEQSDVDEELLAHLPFRASDAAIIEEQSADFKRVDGRRVA